MFFIERENIFFFVKVFVSVVICENVVDLLILVVLVFVGSIWSKMFVVLICFGFCIFVIKCICVVSCLDCVKYVFKYLVNVGFLSVIMFW